MSLNRPKKISEFAVTFGIFSSFLGAIWSPDDAFKWVMTAFYVYFFGKCFGVSYSKDRVVGSYIKRDENQITNFMNLRRRE